MDFGRNIRLTKQDVETAIRVYAHKVGKSRGQLGADADVFDFIERTVVHWNIQAAEPQKQGDAPAAVVDVYITVDK